jgi:HD-GYP domain-containing protein (c-di-GMP phosphodiesterase class II)
MNIDFRQIVSALSDTLDLVGVDDYQHCKRVAFMATECARYMGWEQEKLDHIYHAGLLHDCGVSSSRERAHLVDEFDWHSSNYHCNRGFSLLEEQPVFKHLAEIVLHHHTHWERLKDLPLTTEIREMSNLIFLVDRVDILTARYADQDLLLARYEIQEKMKKHASTLFMPEIMDAFIAVSNSEFFWLTLEMRHLNLYLRDMSQHKLQREMAPQEFLEIARLFANIVDAKSPFTAAHSLGVGRLANHLGNLDGMDQHTCYLLEIAGLLHDLGKLNVPDKILEKSGPLDKYERAIMMRHSFESFQILRQIDGLEKVAEWAATHHETLSGEGYPYRLQQKQLSREARIVAVADVFQALAQARPYREALSMEKILEILQEMGRKNKLDNEIIALVETHLLSCWQAATGHDPSAIPINA